MDPAQFDATSKYYDAKATKEDPKWYSVDVQYESDLEVCIFLSNVKELATWRKSQCEAKNNLL